MSNDKAPEAINAELLAFTEYALKWMQLDIEQHGGCDHSVGVCCCEQLGQMERARSALAKASVRQT